MKHTPVPAWIPTLALVVTVVGAEIATARPVPDPTARQVDWNDGTPFEEPELVPVLPPPGPEGEPVPLGQAIQPARPKTDAFRWTELIDRILRSIRGAVPARRF